MLKKLLTFSIRLWPVLLLTFFSIALAFLNYQPSTWLTGWDNLHSEFNFPLNFKRAIFAPWQEYQSLGLLAGMAHAADLPRVLLLWFLNAFIPTSFLRYLWTFLMLVFGPLGAYFLAGQTIFSKIGPSTRRLISLTAGLFYLLNLATVQTFYTPFETFTSFYGFLPWLLFFTTRYLSHPIRSNLLSLFSILLLAAPAFYTQTLFLVFLFCLLPIILYHLIHTTRRVVSVLMLLTTLFITQTFWLLPNLYFTLTSSSVTINALQNQLSTPEVLARNQEYGNLGNVALLKGFWFDYVDLSANSAGLGPNHQFELMMRPWISHLTTPITLLGYLFAIIAILGIFYSFHKKLPYRWPLITGLFLSLVFVINLNPPTQPLFLLFQKLPLLSQAFRSPFTKWSTPLSLFFSLFFASGCLFLHQLLLKVHRHLTPLLLTSSLTFLLILFTLPAFQGRLLYEPMRQAVPLEYFQLFDYLQNQDPHTRLANFPQQTPWSWQFYNWPGSPAGSGYRGSGFLWYALPQPILDRAFDVWSSPSETYYQEISHAIYSQDAHYFRNLLEKYTVTWILLDGSIIVPDNTDQTSLYLPQIESLISQNPDVTLIKQFGFLKLYQVRLHSQPQDFLSTQESLYLASNYELRTNNYELAITDTPLNNHSVLKEAKNCDNFNSTYFNRQVTPDRISYAAINANSCDHFLYPELPQSQAYQIKITHQNLSGFPLLYCIESYISKNCLDYRYLPQSPNLTTSIIDLSPYDPQAKGYTLHLFNPSIGQNLTANVLKEIQITSTNYPPPQFVSVSPANITNTSHPNPSLYTLTAISDQQNNQLLLNQAYHSGWRLYQIDHLSTTTQTWRLYLEALLLKPLNTHQQFNHWANSWTLPPGQHRFLIIFFPQYLEFLGFALLLPLPVLLLIHTRKAPQAGW